MDPNIELFDSVFSNFIKTNLYRNRNCTPFEIFYTQVDRSILYQHSGNSYIADLKLVNNYDRTWLTITFGDKWFGLGQSHCGTKYPIGFIRTEPLIQFKDIVRQYYNKIKAYYHKETLVIKCLPKDNLMPALRICFMHSNPIDEEDKDIHYDTM